MHFSPGCAAFLQKGDSPVRNAGNTASARPWFSVDGGRYMGSEPSWFDPQAFPWVETVEENWQPVRDEVTAMLAGDPDRLAPYFVHAMSFPPRSWQSLSFMFWTVPNKVNLRRCPRIHDMLRRIPNLVSASVSILEPGASIKPHQGDTNAIIRTHLGLDIPGSLPDCGFQCGDEARSWENGKMHLFLDARTHFAWNRTDRRRILLIIDVMRPEFAAQTRAVSARVIASILLQALYERQTWLNAMPGGVRIGLQSIAQMLTRMYLAMRR